MNSLRRYEILLPLLFNDGTPVPEALLVETFRELREKFGAASWETQVLRGAWEESGALYHDNLTRFFVDVPDKPDIASSSKVLRSISKNAFINWTCGSRRIPLTSSEDAMDRGGAGVGGGWGYAAPKAFASRLQRFREALASYPLVVDSCWGES